MKPLSFGSVAKGKDCQNKKEIQIITVYSIGPADCKVWIKTGCPDDYRHQNYYFQSGGYKGLSNTYSLNHAFSTKLRSENGVA